ncbi:MAG: hypothetical protein RIF32_12970 [Leptospirales bacterium]|jgi:DNA anti-recombination protein RmuC
MAALETIANDTLNTGLGLYKTLAENGEKTAKDLETQANDIRSQVETKAGELRAEFETKATEIRTEIESKATELRTQVEAKIAEIRAQIESGYNDLVNKGAADQSEGVVKLRSLLDQGIAQVKDAQGKIEAALKTNANN